MAKYTNKTVESVENTSVLSKRIKELEALLAKQIERSVELLKENSRLEKDLEKTKKQRDCWHRLYRKVQPDKKIKCDRQKAMVIHGEVDISEVLGRRNPILD